MSSIEMRMTEAREQKMHFLNPHSSKSLPDSSHTAGQLCYRVMSGRFCVMITAARGLQLSRIAVGIGNIFLYVTVNEQKPKIRDSF